MKNIRFNIHQGVRINQHSTSQLTVKDESQKEKVNFKMGIYNQVRLKKNS